MSIYTTEGIILKHKDFREADRVITIYSKDYGKIEAITKGSRKIKSKLAGSLEPFCLVNLNIVKGRNFNTVISSEIIKNYRNIKNNFEKIVLANYFTEIIDSLTKVHHHDPKLFNFINSIFEILDSENKMVGRKIFIIWFFIWRFLSLLGYKPELRQCLKCRKNIKPNNNFFSFDQGGVICSSCNKLIKNKIPISDDTIKILRIILERDLKHLVLIKINKNIICEINKLTDLFLKYHLDKEIKAEGYLSII